MRERQRVDVVTRWVAGTMTTEEAVATLGCSERTAWRLRARLLGAGVAAMAHGNRGRPSPHRLPDEVRERVVGLAPDPADLSSLATPAADEGRTSRVTGPRARSRAWAMNLGRRDRGRWPANRRNERPFVDDVAVRGDLAGTDSTSHATTRAGCRATEPRDDAARLPSDRATRRSVPRPPLLAAASADTPEMADDRPTGIGTDGRPQLDGHDVDAQVAHHDTVPGGIPAGQQRVRRGLDAA